MRASKEPARTKPGVAILAKHANLASDVVSSHLESCNVIGHVTLLLQTANHQIANLKLRHFKCALHLRVL